ncbi:hypothetical protein BRADI_4g30791v3 [Brachypodium distachyon]|uniref:Uncharacterized protein n=1 Tax=Brachypodium distachyon TaxID=15368 RepID=A0A2K2CRI3_BRADI|nr:hypothetical protein BRADI_4g30791v3 [Brachypodium distachyon]
MAVPEKVKYQGRERGNQQGLKEMVQQGEVDAGGEEDHTGAVPGVRSRRRWRLRQGLGDWETKRERDS